MGSLGFHHVVPYPLKEALMDEWVYDLVCRVIPHCKPQFLPEHIKISCERIYSELKLHPLDVSRHVQLAVFHFQLKEFNKAIEALSKARELDRQNAVAYLPLLQGVCHLFLGQFDQADRCFVVYKTIRPDRYEGPLFTSLGSFLARRDNEAHTCIKTAIALETRSFNSRIARARYFEIRNDFDSAITEYEGIIREDPTQKTVYDMLNRVTTRQRQTERMAKSAVQKPEGSKTITLGRDQTPY